MNDSARPAEQAAEIGTLDAPRMTPHTPAPPSPVVLDRARAAFEAERQIEVDAHAAWADRQRIEADERRKRGMERAARAAGEYRDWRDQKDAKR